MRLLRGRSKSWIYPSPIYPGVLNQTVVVCSDQVRITRYLSSVLPVTKIFPGVVWFEEVPHHLEEIDGIVQKADLAIVVGTSSTVRGTGENRQVGHYLMISSIRYSLLPAMHSKSRTTEARLPYSISTRVPEMARLIICSLAHVPKLYLRFLLAINSGLTTC